MKRYIDLFKETFRQWSSHEAPRMGAALAFYSVLSLAPLVILVVGICAFVFGASGAQTQLLAQFRAMVGDQGAAAIETVLKSAQKPGSGIVANVFGLITLSAFGCRGGISESALRLQLCFSLSAKLGRPGKRRGMTVSRQPPSGHQSALSGPGRQYAQ